MNDNVINISTAENTTRPERLCRLSLRSAAIETLRADLEGMTLFSLKASETRRRVARLAIAAAGIDTLMAMADWIRCRHGGAVLISLPENAREIESLAVALACAETLGEVRVHLESGDCFDRIHNVHRDLAEIPEHEPSPYRAERLHTDGHADPMRSDHFLILNHVRESGTVGGENTLLHIDDWEDLESFTHSPWGQVPTIFAARFGSAVAHTDPDIPWIDQYSAPVFYRDESGLCIRFAREFMHPQDPAHRRYLDELTDSLDGSRFIERVKLTGSQLLIINNKKMLHGRTAMQINPNLERVLRRIRGRFL